MDLILWRHADAEEGERDLERKLTAKGRKQAARMGEWLTARLPSKYTVSRARRGARARPRTRSACATGSRPPRARAPRRRDSSKRPAGPRARARSIVVGHQPDLGHAAAVLLSGAAGRWSVKKGGLWWLATASATARRRWWCAP